MKRILIMVSLFLFAILAPLPAHADSRAIYLTSSANRSYQGEITNKDFEGSLAPDGALGKLIYAPIARPRSWIIDAALIEDVQYLSDKNSTVAKNWLSRLKGDLGGDPVYATAYGNPDISYVQSLAPSELNFYYEVGQRHLEAALLKNVNSEKGSGFSYARAKISSDVREFFNLARQDFINLSTVVNPKELESDRARMAQLFSPQLNDASREALLRNFEVGQAAVIGKLKIVSGRYQITSANQKMPLTLVNDFASSVKVDLLFTPMNSRVVFPEYRQITLVPKSKMQVSVPIKTIAAGDVIVMARFENGKGKLVGESGMLELSSTIISPAVTKFTTGAGIVLILAAIAQSVRRVRRARKA